MKTGCRLVSRVVPCVVMAIAFILVFSAQSFAAGIGVMGAMKEEIDMLKKSMTITRTENIGNRVFYVGKCEGRDIVLVQSHVGKINAALTAQTLIRDFGVDRIIFTGVAGAIAPELMPGDIVIGTRLYEHDYGMLKRDEFLSSAIMIPDKNGVERMVDGFDTDPALVDLAVKAAPEAGLKKVRFSVSGPPRTPVVVKGVIVTGDQFIASTKKKEWLQKKFEASAVEMEGAALMHVCATYGTACLVVRCMSDQADDVAGGAFMLMKNDAADNSARLVRAILKDIPAEL